MIDHILNVFNQYYTIRYLNKFETRKETYKTPAFEHRNAVSFKIGLCAGQWCSQPKIFGRAKYLILGDLKIWILGDLKMLKIWGLCPAGTT